jgi:hypothetical protein
MCVFTYKETFTLCKIRTSFARFNANGSFCHKRILTYSIDVEFWTPLQSVVTPRRQ